MDRRRFLRLAGLTAAYGLPMVARAGQGFVIEGAAGSCPVDHLDQLVACPVPEQGAVIKVIGVGGAGGNAVDYMMRKGIDGVEFIAANTDARALKRSIAKNRLQLGESGLGAGAKPEAGRKAALEERKRIAESLKGTHMLFIVAGMGGGTGTGAAPVIAEVARELGILTVAMVTTPFSFEGKRLKLAKDGIAELHRYVDSLIVFPNDKLTSTLSADVTMDEALRAADEVMCNGVGDIARIINIQGLVNVDFEDVRTVMAGMGMAMMGSANASGANRARLAAEQAIASPLLERITLPRAKGVLVVITATRGLRMKEVNEVMNTVREFAAEDAHIIFGAIYDEGMGTSIGITVVATGYGSQHAS